MNLSGLEVFVKVVQLGSISRAARALDMPVTTASGQLAALERRLGVTLIQRSTRQLRVTTEGEAYYRHCALALAEIDAGEQELALARTEPFGPLRLTTTPDIASQLLPPLLSGYLCRYPKVQVDLLATYRLVDLIGEGVDLALRLGDAKDSSLMARKFLDLRLSLWAAPAYLQRAGVPLSPAELPQHRLLRYQAQRDQLILYRDGETASVPLGTGRITIDDFDSLKAFALLGEGIAPLPDYLAQTEAAAGRLQRVLPDWSWEKRTLRFVYPPRRFIAPSLQSFVDYCLENVPEFS